MGNPEKGVPQPKQNRDISVVRREVHRGPNKPAFAELSAADLANGIDDGTITDSQAVRVLVRKEFELHRLTHHGTELQDLEKRYAPLLAGKTSDLAGYCQRAADRYASLNYYVDHHDITDYAAAARWYDMAARLSHETAHTEPQGEKLPPVPTDEMLQAASGSPLGPPPEWMRHSYQALDKAQTIVDGIESGALTDPEDVHDLIAWQLEMKRVKPHSAVPKVAVWREKEEAKLAPCTATRKT
jgi:hypothetical protein